MDTAYISAISALAGSVIGGLTTALTTWLSQRSQARAGQIAHDLARREDLIRDFIVAASKTYGDAIVNNEPKMPELIDLYAMVSRMRVLNLPRSVVCAENVMHDPRYLFGPESDDWRFARARETGRGRRPAERLRRSRARGAAPVHGALTARALAPARRMEAK